AAATAPAASPRSSSTGWKKGCPPVTIADDTETALADEMAACFADPLRFVRLAFDWGAGDLAGHDGPDAMQEDVLRTIRDRLAAPAGALRMAVSSGHGV